MSGKRRFRVSELLRCDLFSSTPFADDAMAHGSLMHAVFPDERAASILGPTSRISR
jgi:hypothetical protein